MNAANIFRWKDSYIRSVLLRKDRIQFKRVIAGKRSALSYNDKKELLLKKREEIECSTVQGTRKRMGTGKDEMVEKAVV